MAQQPSSRWRSDLFGLIIGTLVSSIIAVLYLQGVFRGYECRTRDLRQKYAAPPRLESPDIVIVDIDESSIQALSRQSAWPWPRQIHAHVVDYLIQAEAKALVFDVLFIDKAPSMIDPDTFDPLVENLRKTQADLGSIGLEEARSALRRDIEALAALNQHNDQILAKFARLAGNVFFAMILDEAREPISLTAAQRPGILRLSQSDTIPEKAEWADTGPAMPVTKLLEAAKGVGHINYAPDPDGVIRSIDLFIRHKSGLYPSLATQAAAHLLGVEPSGVQVVRGRSFRLSEDGRTLFVPVDDKGLLHINYTRTFRRIPYHQVLCSGIQLRNGQRPEIDPKEFAGKTVFVGASARGLKDLRATPVEAEHMGAGVQAQVLANLLEANSLRETGRGVTVAIIYASGVLLGMLLQRLSPGVSTLLSLLLLFAYCMIAAYLFRILYVWVDIAAPAAAMIFCHIAIIGHKLSSVERQHFLEKQLIQHELDIAHDVQMSLLPKSDPVVPNADISGWTRPCDDTGGDYYDFMPLADGRLAIALGDVTGHGLGPALIMAATRSYLRSVVHHASSPGEILTAVNNLLCGDLEHSRFVTLFFCILDPRTGEITYSSAGHEAPLILRAGRDDIDEFESTGLPLGLMPDESYEDGPSAHLEEGDLLVILTDGVFEAMNRRQEQFGHERLIGTLRASMQSPAADVIQKLHRAVEDFRGSAAQQDDITMVIVKMAQQDDEPSDEVQFEAP